MSPKCLYQAHVGRTVLPKWPLWAHLFYSVFTVLQNSGGYMLPPHVAQAVLLPDAWSLAETFALPLCTPKSHLCPLPHLGLSDLGRPDGP